MIVASQTKQHITSAKKKKVNSIEINSNSGVRINKCLYKRYFKNYFFLNYILQMDFMTDNSLKSPEEQDLKSRPQESLARLEARRKLAKQIVETKQKLDKLIIEINQDMEVKKEDFAKEKDLKSRPQESFARLEARRKLAQIVETKQKLDKLIIEINQDIMEVKKKTQEDVAKEKGKRERARKVVIMFRSMAVSSLLCGLFYDNIGLPKTVIPFFVVLGCGSFGLALHFENEYLKPKKSCNPTEDEKELLSSILASVEDMEMNL